MGKEKTATLRCVEPGCGEYGHFSYRTREDYNNLSRTYREGWRCTRHRSPDKVLTPDNPERTRELVAMPIEGIAGLFWDGLNGFSHGPGFLAWAKDFPEGTRLIVTARIILPEAHVNSPSEAGAPAGTSAPAPED